MGNVLEIKDVYQFFETPNGMMPAVRGISLDVPKGKTLVVLGESGSGKSVMLRTLLKLTPSKAETKGEILFKGEDILSKNENELRKVRGNEIAMIFQDALTALDPLYRVGDQIIETIRNHSKVSYKTAYDQAVQLLKKVGIPSPETRMSAFPHELSGGMRQRIVIAMALSCNPSLLLADEPTTALDVTIQAQILDLFTSLQKEYEMSIILVTHDMGVAAQMADEIAIMYAGKIVEVGSVEEVLFNAKHPYTKGLLLAIPNGKSTERLFTIPKQPPLIWEMPQGCAFADRCPNVMDVCRSTMPDVDTTVGHRAACHLL